MKGGSTRKRLCKSVASLCFLFPSFMVAQSTAPRGPQLIPRTRTEREQNYENLHRVFLNVQVTMPSGQAAIDFHQTDFELLVDHQPKKIASFQSVNP
jgi:hypothetical protein